MTYIDMFPDPEPIDENDLEAEIESFQLHLEMGLKPIDFVDEKERARYIKWLAKKE